MKVTFTADDGTHFENEADCLAYEGISEFVAAIYDHKEPEQFLQFQPEFLEYLTKHGFYTVEILMKYQRSFLRLAEILQPSEGRHYFGAITENLYDDSF